MTPNVRDLLMGQQRQLQSALGMSDDLGHPGEKGDNSELNWLKTISEFLPKRYQATKGQVLDSQGDFSDVIDVIIFDRQYCPLWFSNGSSHYIPAESVYAVFEAKQNLNKDHVEYASEKAASVRNLHRTSAQVVHVSGVETKPKPPLHIAAGILTTRSDWSPMFGDPLHDALVACSGDGEIDLGCALQHGAFDVEARTSSSVDLAKSAPESALMFFLMRLFSRLQAMGTVPAIDMNAYTASLQLS
jgi:hypothetical protein